MVSGAKFSLKKVLSTVRGWVFSPSTGLRESTKKLQKHWKFWQNYSPNLLSSLNIEKEVPHEVKKNRVPALKSFELRYTHKGAISPGPLHK